MGIDFSHSNAHWAYSGFHRFKCKLAEGAGINLDEMLGFDGKKSWDDIHDDITLFLNHSDCDGKLTPAECEKIIPRILSIIKDWDDNSHDKQAALLLIDGMKDCVKDNEPLEFR